MTTITKTTIRALAIFATLLAPGLAAANEAQEEANKAIVRQAFDQWRAGTGGPFALLTPDADWTITGSSPLSKTYATKQQFLDEVIGPFNARMQRRLLADVKGIHADDDMVIVRFDAEAIAKDGVPYVNSYTWHLRMRDGMIVEAFAFLDTRLLDEFWVRVKPE